MLHGWDLFGMGWSTSKADTFPCGERACPRWAAQQPQTQALRSFQKKLSDFTGAAAQPNAGKPARHNSYKSPSAHRGRISIQGLARSGRSPVRPRAWRTNTALASGIWSTSFNPALRSQRNGS